LFEGRRQRLAVFDADASLQSEQIGQCEFVEEAFEMDFRFLPETADGATVGQTAALGIVRALIELETSFERLDDVQQVDGLGSLAESDSTALSALSAEHSVAGQLSHDLSQEHARNSLSIRDLPGYNGLSPGLMYGDIHQNPKSIVRLQRNQHDAIP
jgi:hypothetical protein